jgi:hypothetical protein
LYSDYKDGDGFLECSDAFVPSGSRQHVLFHSNSIISDDYEHNFEGQTNFGLREKDVSNFKEKEDKSQCYGQFFQIKNQNGISHEDKINLNEKFGVLYSPDQVMSIPSSPMSIPSSPPSPGQSMLYPTNSTIISPLMAKGTNHNTLYPVQSVMIDPLTFLQLKNQLVAYRTVGSNNTPQTAIFSLSPLYMPVGYQQVGDSQTFNGSSIEVKDDSNPKKRKSSQKNQRRVRPKVMPEKGAVQCKGMNRKKNQRCGNAALMEFIGPRPHYCAEHIHLDVDCLYMKCSSNYQKVPGDKKKCREVVLKEFGLCHKHFQEVTLKMIGQDGLKFGVEKLNRVNELLNNLEEEAVKAKKTNIDLYQRKNKLIPKFLEMKQTLSKHISFLRSQGYSIHRNNNNICPTTQTIIQNENKENVNNSNINVYPPQTIIQNENKEKMNNT